MAKPEKKSVLSIEDIERQGRRLTKETLGELKGNLEWLEQCGMILPAQKYLLDALDELILIAPPE